MSRASVEDDALAAALLSSSVASSAAATAAEEQIWHRLDALPADRQHRICNTRDSAGRTALHHACLCGSAWLVRRLVSHGVRTVLQDGQGQTALHLALRATSEETMRTDRSRFTECAHTILDEEERRASQTSASATDVSMASEDASDSSGESAAKRAKLESNGASGDIAAAAAANSESDTPVSPSSSSSSSSISSLSLRDSFGRLPLHWSLAVPSLLLRCLRAELVSSQTQSGDTAVHWAAQDGNEEALGILLNAGADVTLQNGRGQTVTEVAKNDAIKKAIEGRWNTRERKTSITTE